ncbi:MAG: hypothetical protein ACLUN7_06610 [Bifidobacterium angulatum]|uniref:hypothetical protein n=1 Tax=Bifidobacterium angulatum TaxID=1683 RepID=UPI003994A502
MKQDMDGTGKSFWQSAGYVSWFTADTASAVGAAMRALAISLLGYAVSGSTVAAGWLGTSSMIAQQVASVFGGTFVDRHDRKRLIVTNAVVGVLAWSAIAMLLLCGALPFPVLLLIAVLASGINGFLEAPRTRCSVRLSISAVIPKREASTKGATRPLPW